MTHLRRLVSVHPTPSLPLPFLCSGAACVIQALGQESADPSSSSDSGECFLVSRLYTGQWGSLSGGLWCGSSESLCGECASSAVTNGRWWDGGLAAQPRMITLPEGRPRGPLCPWGAPWGATWLFFQAYSILLLALCFRVEEVSIWGRWNLQENVGPSFLC